MTRTTSSAIGRRSVLVALALAGVFFHVAASGETPTAYRRILVPADSPSTWPRDGETFLPVEARDFDAWIAAANQPTSAANIAAAEYEARLEGNELTGGRGLWRIVLHGERSARMPVGGTSLVIRNARWRGEANSPARLGWSAAGVGEPLVYALEVPRSGEIEFDWHVTPVPTATGAIEVPLRLPIAASTRLLVDLPANKRPVLEGSVVLESPAKSAAGGRWVLAVGASPSAVLRIEDANRAATKSELSTVVREVLRYDVGKRGIELEAKLQLATRGVPLKELSVSLPTGLQLIAAAVGEHDLKWRVAEDKADGAVQAVVELLAAPPDGSMTVVLRAWGPLVTGEPLRLPKLTARDAFWTSGTIELVLDPSLELRDLSAIDCVQITAEAAPTARDLGQLRRFAAFSPSAAVELALDHRPASGRARLGTTLEVGNPGVAGRLVAEVCVDRGSLHKLSAEIQPGWSIDAVETIPADALGEWYVDRAGSRQTIELQLHRAVTPRQRVTIIVTGRLQRAAALEPLPLDALVSLKWSDLAIEGNLLQLKAAEQFELESVGEWQSVAADNLSADERQLFTAPAEGQLCDLATSPAGAAIRLTPKKGAYDAAIQLEATLAQGQLRQSYRVDCRPRGSGIDHVLVYLSEPTAEPLRWIDARSQEPLVAERMPARDPRLGGLPPGGELWLLHLRRLYARPIAIAATQITPWPQRRRITLVSLPDAESQQGRVTVSSGGAELPTIVAQDMVPTPLPLKSRDNSPPERSAETCAIYRFQPTRFYDAGRAPELWLGPAAAESGDNQMLATEVDVESHFAADGSGIHHVTYQLENHGATEVELTLPPGVQFESARVDGQPVPSMALEKIAIQLSARKLSTVLELDLASQSPPLGNGCRIRSPLPSAPITILHGHWTILLPHDFAAVGAALAPADEAFDWQQRLFGPLARPRGERRFNPFAARDWNTLWAGVSRSMTTPAQAAEDPSPGNSPMPTGWHAFHFGFVAALPDAITIAHPPATTAWALAIFLACALGTPLCGWRTQHAVLLAVVAAALSLLLPIVYAPLATAAVLGLLAAAIWKWVKHFVGINRPTLAIVAAAVVLASAPAHAAPRPEAVQRVLVPVDADGQSTGSKYFVGAEFLRRLMRSSTQSSGSGTWLLTDMRCDGELVPGTDSTELRSGNWSVTFEIDVLVRDATVELPLVRHEAEWPAAASLDGMPAPIEWAATGRGCSIQVAEPGHYRLTIPFEPRVEEAAGRRQVALSLPPVAGAAVRIASPAGLADLRCGGTLLARRDDAGRAVWQGKMDASKSLTASWTDHLAATSANENRRVDELLWLHVEPDGVVVDAKYVLPSGANWPEVIDVAVADDWELLSGSIATSTDHAEVSPDGRQLLHVRVPQAAAGNRHVALRFRARESSPLGRLRVPEIRLTSLPVENCWLAISGAAELECAPSAAPSAAAGPLSEFIAAWGAADEAAPQFVWNAAKLDANWHLAVRPRMELSTCRDRLSLAAGRDWLRVNYRSDVMPKGANCFAWSLEVPAELAVQNIAITSTGKPIAIDWVRATPNRIIVFIAETVSKSYRLQLNGRLPIAQIGRLPVPRIGPAGQPQPTQTVALYRDDDVLAEWHFPGEAPWVESGASQSPPFGPESHFVRAYSVDPLTADAVRIFVEPNEPAVSGETVTTIAQENRVWTATYACALHVERGELDGLRLRVPPTFAGPFTVTPTATTEITPSAGTRQSATLSIRLPQPARVGDVVKFEVRSPLALADGELPTAPQIVPLVAGARQNYLALPASLDGERAVWTHTGIEPAELPRELRPDSSDLGVAETFRIAANPMNVALRPRPARASSATVRLAETTVHLGPAGGKFAVTRFIVAPEGLDQCVVELPAGERLVRVTLDGHPALARSLGPRRWQVQLGPPNLPQTLEFVSRTVDRSEASSRLVELSRPVLELSGQPIPVDLSLWTLYRSATGGTPRVTGGAVVTPAELAATRLDRLASISQSATRSAIESPVVDGFNWFAHWAAEIQVAERAAKSLPLPPTGAAAAIRVPQPSDNLLSDNIARCDAWIEQVAEIFAAAEMTLSGPESPAPAAFDLWQDTASSPGDRVCFISDGGQDRLYVELVPDGLTVAATRFAALASMAALALAAIWLVRTPPALELVKGWPEAVGVVLGLAAWAWLRPSLAGLVVVAVSLTLVVRRLYLVRKSPRHDSSKQSNSIQEELAKL